MVKKRFLNMKETFMDNHRKIRESKQRCSRKSPDEIYTPKWNLYNHLLFLLKTVAQAESFSNCPNNPSSNSQCEIAPMSSTLPEETQQLIQIYYDDNLQNFMMIPQEKETKSSCSGESSLSSYPLQPSIMSPISVPAPLSSSIIDTRPVRSASAPVVESFQLPNARFIQDQSMYDKRGAKKLKSSPTEEALDIMKQMATQSIPIPQGDSAEYFGGYVAAKLREMDLERHKSCEEEIMKVLLD